MFSDRELLEMLASSTQVYTFYFDKESEEAPYSLVEFMVLREKFLNGTSTVLYDKDVSYNVFTLTEEGKSKGLTIRNGELIPPKK